MSRFVLIALLLVGCGSPVPQADRPRLSAHLSLRDITFHSKALDRDMVYRVFVPTDRAATRAVYLLHGGGGGFRDWSNYSDIAALCDQDGWLLVMPEAKYSYYTNAVERPKDRYEDYIIDDLSSDVEQRFPTAKQRAVIGVSMGGFGAIKLAMRHPDRFEFVVGLSSAIDVPRRKFSIRRASQWRDHASIFGPQDGPERLQNDPFVLARSTDPAKVPYFYLTAGSDEGLIEPNREFDALLTSRGFRHEFHIIKGGHDWTTWNFALRDCIQSLRDHVRPGAQ